MDLNLDILLAEPEMDRAEELSRQLLGQGHRVLARAADGPEACRLCQRLEPDLALMDTDLPGLDGIEAAVRIMNRRPLPVVLLTGRADPDFLRRASSAGVCGYLLRPVDPVVLGQSMCIAAQAFEREQDLRRDVADLKAELETRKLISRAMGILMEQRGVGTNEAAERIDEQAATSGLSRTEVAKGIIAARELARGNGR